MAGRDAAHSGAADGPGPPYREAWSRDVGLGGPVAGPVVARDAVVVVAARGVVALDPATGEVLWEMDRSEGPAGTPAVVGELVVHASGSESSGALVARNLEDGIEAWRAFVDGSVPGGLVASGGLVYAATTEGTVVAVEAGTGEERWRSEVEGRIEATPAVAGGLVLVASENRQTGVTTLYALDAERGPGDGPATWRFSPPNPSAPASAPASAGRRAFLATSDGAVRAVDLETGEEAWAAELRATVSDRQVPAAGSVLVVADRLHVYGLDANGGGERWVFRLADLRALPDGRTNTLGASSPAVSEGAAVIGDASGVLSAVDLGSGRRVWIGDIGPGPVGAVAVGSEHIFAASLGPEGSVVGLERDPDGALLDEVSPTTLFPLQALLNFLVALVAVGVPLLVLSRLALRRRAAPSGKGGR